MAEARSAFNEWWEVWKLKSEFRGVTMAAAYAAFLGGRASVDVHAAETDPKTPPTPEPQAADVKPEPQGSYRAGAGTRKEKK